MQKEDLQFVYQALCPLRADLLSIRCGGTNSHDPASRAPSSSVRIMSTNTPAMTKYILCKNLECCCPLQEGQEFCDNCNTPSTWFLKMPEHFSELGSLVGYSDQKGFRTNLEHIHYAFYGMTKTGKTRLAMKMAVEASKRGIKLLVIDPEGEWPKIIPELNGETRYYQSLRNLKINPFELKDKGLISVLLKETIFQHGRQDFFQYTASMEALLDECISMSASIPELIENVRSIARDDLKTKLVNLESTRTAVLVRLSPLQENESLKQIFYCDRSSIDLANLDSCNIVISLADLDQKVAYSRPLRFLYNVIIIAGLAKSLRKPITNRIENMVVLEEATKLIPRIFSKETATDTWIASEYGMRLRKRGVILCLVAQSPDSIEAPIRDNVHANFIFRIHSEENARIIAGLFGIYHYARIDHLLNCLVNLQFREAIVKTPESRPFIIRTVDFEPQEASEEMILKFAPSIQFNYTEAEEQFISNIQNFPFIGVVERRAMLGWDESRYSEVVARLVNQGVIEKQHARLGQGRPKVLYQLKGRKPSVKHEFYCYWIIDKLASKGIVSRAEKVGPDIQIPSINVAINVELGSSNIYGNIPKALKDFQMVVVCSDDKGVLDSISRTKAQNVLCALVQDVPALFGKMRFDSG